MTTLKAIDFKGKPYVTVNERLKYFRENYKDHSLQTTVIKMEDGMVLIKAVILSNTDGKPVILATGHAYEKEGSSFINKTSYVENCETSAWGRALANFGIGIDAAVASYDEVGNAVKQQEQTEYKPKVYPKPEPLTKVDELVNIAKDEFRKLFKIMKTYHNTYEALVMTESEATKKFKSTDEKEIKEFTKLIQDTIKAQATE